ncbi:MAG: NAD-dependent epimerase/dehydratase family protein, partial [Thermoproteota archaeon]|nr:NAD-dependent epimerase/dehydratase family protein [Thermoproteota archaeon]
MKYEKEESKNKSNNEKEKKILVTGGSGFIGNSLLKNLIYKKNLMGYPYHLRCLTRNKKSITSLKNNENDIEIVEGDILNYNDCLRALDNIDVAYYLVHSMEGSTKNWKKFSEKEKASAENFMRASTECGIKRIIYLGGLTYGEDDKVSQHMLSRKHVGEILVKSNAKVTIFRAAVILGSGGSSFEMLRYLVERLAIMICPKWVMSKCQPIFIGDVINYLSQSIEIEETVGKEYD